MSWESQVDALVLREIRWRLRLQLSSEVAGRSHHCHLEIRTNANGDHIFFLLIAQTYASIISARYDVCEPVVDNNFDIDLGIVGLQPHQLRPQNSVGGMFCRCQSDGSNRFVLTQI